MKAEVCVVGAGIVGLTTALELQDRGIDVLLVDKSDPGMETSFGNAGVLSESTVLTVNNPDLFRRLPALVARKEPYFDYDFWHALSRLGWLLGFMRRALPGHMLPIAKALQGLQRISIDRHRQLIARAGVQGILTERGWLKVFRDAKGFHSSSRERQLMKQLGVVYEELSSDAICELEPALKAKYERGLLLTETCSVKNPVSLSRAYLKLFEQQGGRFRKMRVVALEDNGSWTIAGQDGEQEQADDVVLACGPWAPELCEALGYAVPMAWERGYHVQLESPETGLRRPVLETAHGIVLSPQEQMTRVSTGVEFAHRDAPPNLGQIRHAVAAARECAAFGAQADGEPWMGSRPTLPDGLPVIGRASRHDKLWFNFGHQHIGMGTSTGSAAVLADLLTNRSISGLDADAYLPGRFGL